MARSAYIYMIMDRPSNGVAVAVFTVKHEMVSWVRTLWADHEGLQTRPWTVWRWPDGDPTGGKGVMYVGTIQEVARDGA